MTTDCAATGPGISTGSPGARYRFSAATAWRGRCVSRRSLTGDRFQVLRRQPAKPGPTPSPSRRRRWSCGCSDANPKGETDHEKHRNRQDLRQPP